MALENMTKEQLREKAFAIYRQRETERQEAEKEARQHAKVRLRGANPSDVDWRADGCSSFLLCGAAVLVRACAHPRPR